MADGTGTRHDWHAHRHARPLCLLRGAWRRYTHAVTAALSSCHRRASGVSKTQDVAEQMRVLEA